MRVLIWDVESEGVSLRDSAASSLAEASLSSEPLHFSWDEIPENNAWVPVPVAAPSRRSAPFEEAAEIQANYYVTYGQN